MYSQKHNNADAELTDTFTFVSNTEWQMSKSRFTARDWAPVGH